MKILRSSKWTITLMIVAALVVLGATNVFAAPKQKNIILATTTSTQDTGLLDVLIPIFEKETGYFVKTIAVGSGQAMAMGQKGEADVMLVHSPDAEKKFIAEGYGINRRLVMHNDFIIVGPSTDPAKIKTAKSSAEAMKLIAGANALFASRGDNSGTHAKESGNQSHRAEMVSGNRIGNGADLKCCGREKVLHIGRQRHLSGDEKESETGYFIAR